MIEKETNEQLYYFDFPLSDPYNSYSKTFFWPVSLWEVLSPSMQEDRLNAFERLFIEVAATENGIPENLLISELGIPRQLYLQICSNLKRKGLLNEGRLTEEGKKAVLEKDYFSEELKIAKAERIIMLQDALSGKIIPFILPRDVKYERVKDGFPILNRAQAKAPEKADIAAALKLYVSYKRKSASKSYDGLDEDSSPQNSSSTGLTLGMDYNGALRIVGRANSGRNHSKCFVRCHLSIDPRNVTNQEPDNIWSVITPFGPYCNEWMRDRLAAAMRADPELNDRIMEKVIEIRESMRDVVAFRNDSNIAILNQYPMLSNDEKYHVLRDRIEDFEWVEHQLDCGMPVNDTWRTRLSNAVDRILKYHLKRINDIERTQIKIWLEDHRSALSSEIRKLFKEYGLEYEKGAALSSEWNYIKNPNVTYDNLCAYALGDERKIMTAYKKTVAVFLLLAVHVCGYRPWKVLIEHDSKLYQKISCIDYYRNREASHDSDSIFKNVSQQERKEGKAILHDMVSAYFGGDEIHEQA